jgi:tRNA pseudouridine38-40 synthase
LTIAYDGTDFVGWQRQARGTSVQGLLEEALSAFEGGPATLHAAGRTDAGVHALAQVASVSMTTLHDAESIRRGLNAALPSSIRVLAAEDAPPGFHARFHAAAKVYEYRIVNAPVLSPFLARYAWHVPQRLDMEAMRRAADRLIGRHDFAAFRGRGSAVRESVRTLDSIHWRGGCGAESPLVVTLTADGFLRHMVRAIVGTLVDIGVGRWAPEAIDAILASRDRVRAGRTAPPCGLFLVEVRY